MPYIAVKAFPKDEEVKNRVADRINEIFLEEWGCPKEAISISFEEVEPEFWEQKVGKPEISKKVDKMKILNGEKKY
jgi:4-oxalocrotonate tautomerase